MRTIPAELAAHLEEDVTSLATCWEIIRRDGVVIRMTDHDVNLTVAGAVFSSATGYDRSAVQSELGLRPDNLNIKGFFDNAAITREDIDNGLYDYAQLRIFIVNHQNTSQGVIKLIRGTLGEVEHSPEGFFSATFQSMAEAFRSVIGDRLTSTCKEDLGSKKCSVPLQPEIRQPGKEYTRGQFVRVPTDASGVTTVFQTLSGPAGIDEYEQDENDPTLWTAFGSWDLEIEEAFPGITLALIDTGTSQITTVTNVEQDSVLARQTGRIKIELIDASNQTTKILYDGGFEEFFPIGSPTQRTSPVTTIPPLSRTLRWTFYIDDPGSAITDSPAADIVYSLLYAQITTFADGYGNQSSFEDRIYECTTAGITAEVQPTFDTTVGNQTVDDTVVWTTRNAWTRDAVVTGVTSRTNFSIDVDEDRAIDNWFTDGVITFESGDNLGRNIEIKTWVQATGGGDVTLHLPLAYDLEVGDILRISPGCNKIHDDHCRFKFAMLGSVLFANGNVRNFRGEPHIPGDARMTRVTYGTRTRVREGV